MCRDASRGVRGTLWLILFFHPILGWYPTQVKATLGDLCIRGPARKDGFVLPFAPRMRRSDERAAAFDVLMIHKSTLIKNSLKKGVFLSLRPEWSD